MYLNNHIKQHLTSFDAFMTLKGDCVRQQKGRYTKQVSIGDQTYFIKQHTGVGWKEIFKNLLQLRWPVISAKTEKRALDKLQSLGVRVPAVAAFGQRGINPARIQSFILLEALTSVISLEDLCKTWLASPPPFAFKQALLQEVACIARTLHENGVNHRDFYICHFLLQQPMAPLKLYLIDLHRAQIHTEMPVRWRIKDLAALYFSSKDIGLTQRDLIRFIECYTGQRFRDIWQTSKHFWLKVKMRGEQLYREHQ